MQNKRDGINVKLERWLEALESNSSNVNYPKSKYMDYNFSRHIQRNETTSRIEAFLRDTTKRFILIPLLDN